LSTPTMLWTFHPTPHRKTLAWKKIDTTAL
jgi:hypothetical protein